LVRGDSSRSRCRIPEKTKQTKARRTLSSRIRVSFRLLGGVPKRPPRTSVSRRDESTRRAIRDRVEFRAGLEILSEVWPGSARRSWIAQPSARCTGDEAFPYDRVAASGSSTLFDAPDRRPVSCAVILG